MGRLTLDAQRQIRGYEPVFRSMLSKWLESHIDATGCARLSIDDVSAGVAHVFNAISQGVSVCGGNKDTALTEYRDGKAKSWKEALDGLREVAT